MKNFALILALFSACAPVVVFAQETETVRHIYWWQEWWVGVIAIGLAIALVVQSFKVRGLRIKIGNLEIELGKARKEAAAHKAEAEKFLKELYLAQKHLSSEYKDDYARAWLSSMPTTCDRAEALWKLDEAAELTYQAEALMEEPW